MTRKTKSARDTYVTISNTKVCKNKRNNRLNDWVTRKTKSARDINETIGYQGKVKVLEILK